MLVGDFLGHRVGRIGLREKRVEVFAAVEMRKCSAETLAPERGERGAVFEGRGAQDHDRAGSAEGGAVEVPERARRAG